MLREVEMPEKYLDQLTHLLHLHVPKAEVWAYGSRVNGSSHETSDLDIVLRNNDDLSSTVDGYPNLKEALQDCMIPIIVDVHDWATLPDTFHDQIASNYVVLNIG